MRLLLFSCVILFQCLMIACDESLPPYGKPEGTLVITRVLANQGTVGDGFPILNVYIEGLNQYEETFDDTVHVKGEVRIWWKDHPDVYATVSLSNSDFIGETPIQGTRLTLDPGAHFFMQTVWYFYTDDGRYVINLLDYSNEDVRGDWEYARPETFVVEVELLMFHQIGLIQSEPIEIEITGYRRVKSGA